MVLFAFQLKSFLILHKDENNFECSMNVWHLKLFVNTINFSKKRYLMRPYKVFGKPHIL